MTSMDCLPQDPCFMLRAQMEPLCLRDGAGGMHCVAKEGGEDRDRARAHGKFAASKEKQRHGKN